jgi:hypothetical protein
LINIANEQITVVHDRARDRARNTGIRRLPIPVEYRPRARPTWKRRGGRRYLHLRRVGQHMHNIEPLEQDLDTTVVT